MVFSNTLIFKAKGLNHHFLFWCAALFDQANLILKIFYSSLEGCLWNEWILFYSVDIEIYSFLLKIVRLFEILRKSIDNVNRAIYWTEKQILHNLNYVKGIHSLNKSVLWFMGFEWTHDHILYYATLQPTLQPLQNQL